MKNRLVGLVLYIIFLLSTVAHFHILEGIVLFSILIFLPIVFEIIDWTRRDGSMQPIAKWTMLLYPIAGGSATFSFIFDSTVFAIVWFVYTLLLAMIGLSRILERGLQPLSELAIDSGLVYLAFGGFWLYATVSGSVIGDFSPYIIFLTAVHFHYSAFVLPIITGLLGRLKLKQVRLYRFVALVIIVSPMTVAIGITFSVVIEFIAVLAYLLAIYMYGYLVLSAPFRNRFAKKLVSFSAFVLLITIAFSLYYAYGRVSSEVTITIDQMVWIHGVSNAIGVLLPALIGWGIERIEPASAYYGKPFSRIRGQTQIGSHFIEHHQLEDSWDVQGLVDKMSIFDSSSFQTSRLAPTIVDFYEQTDSYKMKAFIKWKPWFQPLAFVYDKWSRYVQQIHLGLGSRWETMNGCIVPMKSERDGRKHVRAWMRKNEKEEVIFLALYSTHTFHGETYMNIALPLLFSNMTGILRLQNHEEKLILTSISSKDNRGDEGIYLVTKWLRLRLPLSETFSVKESEPFCLEAHHRMKMMGISFLNITYHIEKMR